MVGDIGGELMRQGGRMDSTSPLWRVEGAGHPLSAQTPDLRIRGWGIHPFRWTNIDTRYPRPYTPPAAIVAVDSVRIAAGVVDQVSGPPCCQAFGAGILTPGNARCCSALAFRPRRPKAPR
jgi:hypothetical protein